MVSAGLSVLLQQRNKAPNLKVHFHIAPIWALFGQISYVICEINTVYREYFNRLLTKWSVQCYRKKKKAPLKLTVVDIPTIFEPKEKRKAGFLTTEEDGAIL